MYTRQTNTALLEQALPSLLSVADHVSGSRLDELTNGRVDDLTRTISTHLLPIVEEIRLGNASLRTELHSTMGNVVRRGQIQSRMITQPQGYAGDYLTLDWIYQQPYEGSRQDDVWNRFCYRQQASRAVRSRIDIVRSLVSSVISRATSPKRFLDVASGPGRIERKVIDQLGSPHSAVHFDLVDADADAIEYSRALLSDEVPPGYTFEFHHRNAFRFEPSAPYDAIWCCGLFDYLDERRAVRLLAKMYSWLGEGGTMLIGNFAKECTTQWIMEGLYGWSLIYRTNDECEQLCYQAGIPSGSVTLERDETGSVVLIGVEK
ncbi:MAG: class I SAM-dependent methyltransferase [Ignavibacteria bacterium]|nr:class I SAM-dependent methyltransferase [Ignavibacteria bacterium]MBK6420273.1 class I SAM-dependent methyltransferase [Ignavibacteria bacterium]MBK7412776.1 class I SAM-dependent methyltransferase [Ignavibacteria bacterium]